MLNFLTIIIKNNNWSKPPNTDPIAKGKDFIIKYSFIKKQLTIKHKFKITGVKERAQNLPDTFVATPKSATIEIKGMNKIVILVINVMSPITTILFEKPGANK